MVVLNSCIVIPLSHLNFFYNFVSIFWIDDIFIHKISSSNIYIYFFNYFNTDIDDIQITFNY